MSDAVTRPDEVMSAVHVKFTDVISRHALTTQNICWGNDGELHQEYYVFEKILQSKLLSLIIENLSNQTEFWVLDLGAGQFAWGRKIAEYLDKLFSGTGIKIHIVSVSADRLGITKTDTKCSYLYELGGFKCETLEAEFARVFSAILRNKMKFDLVISSFLFCHLVDPIGMLWQAYNRLASQGIMLVHADFDQVSFNGCFGDIGSAIYHVLMKLSPCVVEGDLYFIVKKTEEVNYFPLKYRQPALNTQYGYSEVINLIDPNQQNLPNMVLITLWYHDDTGFDSTQFICPSSGIPLFHKLFLAMHPLPVAFLISALPGSVLKHDNTLNNKSTQHKFHRTEAYKDQYPTLFERRLPSSSYMAQTHNRAAQYMEGLLTKNMPTVCMSTFLNALHKMYTKISAVNPGGRIREAEPRRSARPSSPRM